MNKKILILAMILSIFLVGMLCAFAVEPVNAVKYKNKKSITVKVKDGKRTIKVKCKYKKSYKQYLGSKKKSGKRYDVSVNYEKNNKMQSGKKGWSTFATNNGLADGAKWGYKHNKYHPVTTVKLHY